MNKNLNLCTIKKKNKKQLSVVVGAVRFSADNPSNFYDTTFSVSPSLIKV